MIIERGGRNKTLVRLRNEQGERVTQEYTCEPYFFIEETAVPLNVAGVIKYETGYSGVYGEALCKVYTRTPEDIHDIRKELPHLQTWEANIPFNNRVLAENSVLPSNYEHRVWYLDCEWSINTGKLTIMVVYDSFSNEYFVFFTHLDYPAGFYKEFPCLNHPDGMENLVLDRPAIAFKDEKAMLKAFCRHLRKQDPDIITGWNVVNADIQKIVKRLQANGLDARMLSPINRIRYTFGRWAQPIGGVNTIDMMTAFTPLWVQKNGQLPDKSLATVSKECLDETKVELADGHDTYYSDFGTYLDYSIQDVRLLPQLNAINNCLEHYTAIQHIVGCDIRTTPYITKILTVLALRDTEFDKRIPTQPQFDYEPYTGASVAEPNTGVYSGVAILDVKAMYHSNVGVHNIGHETLSEDGVDCGNGVCFNKDKPSLLLRQMDKMTLLREQYKRALKHAKTEEEVRRYEALQFATKTLVASLYGAAGDSKYGLYHPKVAAAITYTSRETLRTLRKECEDEGYEVLYSHTDSAFVQIPSPEEALNLIARINKKMSPIETVFERWCENMLLKAKNRYAASVTWTDGEYHEAKGYVKGIEMKQSRMFPVMKEVMGLTINSILNGGCEKATTTEIVGIINNVLSGKQPIEDLCMRGKLERDLSKYKVLSGSSAGASWANDVLGKGYRAGSNFKVSINSEGRYIAFDEPHEIEGFCDIGFKDIVERFIVKKIEPYYEVARWDIQPIRNAFNEVPTVGFI